MGGGLQLWLSLGQGLPGNNEFNASIVTISRVKILKWWKLYCEI